MSKVSFRVDGGSNCQILVREEHFIYLIRKSISCSLANGAKSKFHGIGVAVVTLKDTPVLLAPCYYSKTDDVSTLSPGALMRYSGCSRAVHSALQHLEICKDGRSTLIPVETVAGLDYLKGSIHHFKGPLETKTGRNSFLTIKPPKFILNSGHYLKYQKDHVTTSPGSTSTSFKDCSPKRAPVSSPIRSEPEPQVSSRGRTRKPRTIMNVESFSGKHYSDQCQIVPTTKALLIKDRRKTLLATYLHRKFGCQCMEHIVKTAKLGHIKGIPKDIGKYDVKCPLCVIAAGTKLPRGKLRDCTEFRKGSCFHFDFAIFNTESCRGFMCALVIVEVRTRKKWGFLAHSRSPLLESLGSSRSPKILGWNRWIPAPVIQRPPKKPQQ